MSQVEGWFRFDSAQLAKARAAYLLVREQPEGFPWALTEEGDPNPAAELWEHELVGEMQIAVGDDRVFRSTGPLGGEEDVNVGWVLFGLYHGLHGATAGHLQVMLFAPDYQELHIRADSPARVCVSGFHGVWACATTEDWLAAADNLLSELRTELVRAIPELDQDGFVGDWLRGGDLPRFRWLVGTPN